MPADGLETGSTPSLPDAEQLVAWAHAEHCRRALVDVAERLAPIGVTLVAFKGIHLAYAVAPSPWFRRFADADALVVGASLSRALARLRATGDFDIVRSDGIAAAVSPRARPGCVDLHGHVLPFAQGRFDGRSIAARARPCAALGSVLVPDPLDGACIAIGHFNKDHVGLKGTRALAGDLLVLEGAGVRPDALATRLRERGLRRAGIVAFTALVAREGARWSAWLDACAPSRVERGAASFVLELARRTRRVPGVGALAARAVADEPGRALLAMTIGIAERVPWLVRDAVTRRRGDSTRPT